MTTYMYIGTEQYFVPVVSPRVEVNEGDTIKLTSEQAKNLDKRFFNEVSDECVQSLEKQIKDLQAITENLAIERQSLIDEMKAKHKQEIENATAHKSDYIASLQVQIERLESIRKVVSSKDKKESTETLEKVEKR